MRPGKLFPIVGTNSSLPILNSSCVTDLTFLNSWICSPEFSGFFLVLFPDFFSVLDKSSADEVEVVNSPAISSLVFSPFPRFFQKTYFYNTQIKICKHMVITPQIMKQKPFLAKCKIVVKCLL